MTKCGKSNKKLFFEVIIGLYHTDLYIKKDEIKYTISLYLGIYGAKNENLV